MSLYDYVEWCVYLNGADIVLAANTFNDAVEFANKINIVVGEHADETKSNPLIFAQVELWKNVSDDDHEPDKVDWSEYGIKNE